MATDKRAPLARLRLTSTPCDGLPVYITALRPSLRFVGPDDSRRDRRPHLDLGHQHHIDDMQAVIPANHQRRPSPGPQRDEIGMRDVYPRPIRQAQRERSKWCRVDRLVQILRPQVIGSAIVLEL